MFNFSFLLMMKLNFDLISGIFSMFVMFTSLLFFVMVTQSRFLAWYWSNWMAVSTFQYVCWIIWFRICAVLVETHLTVYLFWSHCLRLIIIVCYWYRVFVIFCIIWIDLDWLNIPHCNRIKSHNLWWMKLISRQNFGYCICFNRLWTQIFGKIRYHHLKIWSLISSMEIWRFLRSKLIRIAIDLRTQ